MPREAANRKDLRTRLADLSGWQTATRDDAAVAQWIHETRAMDQVDPLERVRRTLLLPRLPNAAWRAAPVHRSDPGTDRRPPGSRRGGLEDVTARRFHRLD